MIDRASALLGLRTSTLIFTVIHSVNLVLITTTPEDLVWALSWCLSPLQQSSVCRWIVWDFGCFLALRFLPLVQEELQNLLRSHQSRRESQAARIQGCASALCSLSVSACWPTFC